MKINVTVEELRKYSLFVAVPMFGGNCSGLFCKSTNDLSTLCAQYGINVRFYYLFSESLITRGRNYCVDEFLRSDCTHLIFIDADIGFKAKDVLSLLAISTTKQDEFDVLAGPYPKKSISWDKIKKAVEMGKAENPFDLEYYAGDYVFNVSSDVKSFRIDEPVEVSEAGTGFMMIPKRVFEKYAESYPELKYTPDHLRTENFDGSRDITAFFDCEIDPVSRRYLSEDYFFCRNVRKIGMKVHLCPWMELNHVGSYIFKGSMAAIASIGVTPTADKNSNRKTYQKKKT
jgi:hypothetical protein